MQINTFVKKNIGPVNYKTMVPVSHTYYTKQVTTCIGMRYYDVRTISGWDNYVMDVFYDYLSNELVK